MSLLDLSRVTRSLMKVVEESIKASPAWQGLPNPDVTPLPPDQLEGENTVGIYLFHLAEDASVKNRAWPNRPTDAARFTPMGLTLHYVMSARSALPGNLGPFREQLLMGLGAKAFHDVAIVDQGTVIAGVPVLDPALAGDRLRMTMRPIAPHEAVSYWTAGSHALRLSAYYECSVVLLDPEEPVRGSGRVLSYGIQVLVGGPPRLATSRSTVTYRLPGESVDRTFEAQPAQVAPGETVTFLGTDLAGQSTVLQIRADRWPDAVDVDPAWGTVATADQVFATVQTTAAGRAVLPGTYSGSVRVTRGITQSSNATPFQVVPAVTVPAPPYPGGQVDLAGNTFEHPDLEPHQVKVFVGGIALVRTPAGPLPPGTFRVLSPTTLRFVFPPGLVSGSAAALRVIVNDSECAPRWIEVP